MCGLPRRTREEGESGEVVLRRCFGEYLLLDLAKHLCSNYPARRSTLAISRFPSHDGCHKVLRISLAAHVAGWSQSLNLRIQNSRESHMSHKSKQPKEIYRPVSAISSDLGLLEADVREMLSGYEVEFRYDRMKRPCVAARFLHVLAQNTQFDLMKQRSLKSDALERSKESEWNGLFREERQRLIERYLEKVAVLERIHLGCLARVNSNASESSLTASYLLFSKAISCLKIGCLTIENGYWYGGSIIREIDETLDLAHYFVLTKDSTEGQSNRTRWFRENHAPKHSLCRKAIADQMDSLLGGAEADHHSLLNELYQVKSKWTHPSYSSIREVTGFEVDISIKIKTTTCGPCLLEYKLLELADFFRSSIWSTFQTFFMCMQELPLTSEERASLVEADVAFKHWPRSNLLTH